MGKEWKPPVELPKEAETEWYEIVGFFTRYIVTFETALHIERQLDRLPEPRWIEFRDVFGARIRMKAEQILRILESTPKVRELRRAFDQAREQENDTDDDC